MGSYGFNNVSNYRVRVVLAISCVTACILVPISYYYFLKHRAETLSIRKRKAHLSGITKEKHEHEIQEALREFSDHHFSSRNQQEFLLRLLKVNIATWGARDVEKFLDQVEENVIPHLNNFNKTLTSGSTMSPKPSFDVLDALEKKRDGSIDLLRHDHLKKSLLKRRKDKTSK